MPRATPILREARKALEDLNLLKVLQSEISHELSSNHFQDSQSGSLGDFVLDWDSSQSKDVVLQRKCKSGEEVAISALLGDSSLESFHGESMFPQNILMKVCIRKPGLSSILQFDCGVTNTDAHGSDFQIHNAYYLQTLTIPGLSVYRGPSFSSLDPQLQKALKDYLVARGIGESLTKFLLHHLHKKEQGQYVTWLHKLESFLAEGK